jgi:hypothetical protein
LKISNPVLATRGVRRLIVKARRLLLVMPAAAVRVDVLILLAGLPLVAGAGGWLLAGREPAAIARQPLD